MSVPDRKASRQARDGFCHHPTNIVSLPCANVPDYGGRELGCRSLVLRTRFPRECDMGSTSASSTSRKVARCYQGRQQSLFSGLLYETQLATDDAKRGSTLDHTLSCTVWFTPV